MIRSRLRTTAGAVFAAGLLGVLLLAVSARPSGTFVAHDGPTAPGELVVHFRGDLPLDQQEALLRAHGATLSRNLLVPGYVVAAVPAGSEATVGEALARSGVVATTEEDPIREPAAAPNDPYYPQQWNMRIIGLDAAREQSDGSGVTVAVVDTGVAYENYDLGGPNFGQAPDLAATTFVRPCDVFAAPPPPSDPSNCPDAHANDDYGHGTHVTGTIAENTDNGYGTAGIAPKAKIMPIKVCGPFLDPKPNDPSHQSYGCADDKLADGIEYAVQNGADVINLSIAGPAQVNQAVRDALGHARNAGVLVVAASGNGTNGVGHGYLDYPAAIDGVIAVGAVGFFENRAGYSNYGVGEGTHQLDLVAPGGDPAEGSISVILQQTYSTCTSASDFTQFSPAAPCSGTSMAAAHVSGVAALIESKFPGLTATQVRDDLDCSAEDIGDPGYDQQYGNGIVRADRALSDVDHDGIPDCIDASVWTPHPTPIPPADECVSQTLTPSPPSFSPSPTSSEPVTPTPSGPAVTARPTATQGGLSGSGVSPSDTGTPTSTPTDTPTATPAGTATETPSNAPTASDTPTARGQTPTPSPTPTPTATPVPTPPPTARHPLCGDVDCSGAVNAADALGVLQWLTAALLVRCIGLGYVNCDGQLDVADAAMILRHSAELPISLPAGCSGFD